MSKAWLMLLALASLVVAAEPLEGTANVCPPALPPTPLFPATAPLFGMVGPVMTSFGLGTCPGSLLSSAPPCAAYPGYWGPAPGAWCGGFAFPQARCAWMRDPTGGPSPDALYAGFDLNADGNLDTTSGEVVFGPMADATWYTIPSPGPTFRLIAYTVNNVAPGPEAAEVLCS
jgi:hypothetical protein